jgi:hypothetical protein
MSQLSAADHGHAMAAYFGGLAWDGVRRVAVPVRYVDYTSMYPTVFSLLQLWPLVIARTYRARDVTSDVRGWLEVITRAALHDPKVWPFLGTTFCRVSAAGQLLPARAPHEAPDDAPIGALTLGLNALTCSTELWFAVPDLAAAKLLGGSVPEVLEAVRIEPVGKLPGLRPVKLRGHLSVDPRTTDLFRVAIEERQRVRRDAERPEHERQRLGQYLKTFGNGGAYGIFAEYHRLEPVAGGAKVAAWGLWPIEACVRTPEEPGEFCFPAIAASVTSGARLLLALLRADVEAAGAIAVAGDTDSLLIASSEGGGLLQSPGGSEAMPDGRPAIRLLAWNQVDDILASLNALNPYAPDTVPSLVKVEDENRDPVTGQPVELWAVAISAKRYSLYQRTSDGPLFRKCSTHGLGLYRAPTPNSDGWTKDWPDWVELLWNRIVREIEGLPLPPEPGWFDLAAVGQLSITSPHLLAPFRAFNAGRPFRDQVKPFGFLLVGHADPLAPLPAGILDGVVPVAPFTSDPSAILSLPWFDKRDGRPLKVTTRPGGEHGKVRLRTYRDVFTDYRFHPESKSGDPGGGPGRRTSIGVLPRLHLIVAGVPRHIGKESNQLEEVEEGAILDPGAVYVEFRDERREWEAMLPALRRLREERGWRYLAEATGLSERAVRYALNAGVMPRRTARAVLVALVRA